MNQNAISAAQNEIKAEGLFLQTFCLPGIGKKRLIDWLWVKVPHVNFGSAFDSVNCKHLKHKKKALGIIARATTQVDGLLREGHLAL